METKKIVRCALVAALYAACSLALAPISFGAVQFRIAEALTLLPLLTADAVAGVTLGCFITNLAGLFGGVNPLGAADLALGTAATLGAALCTRALRGFRIKKLPLLSALAPVAFNAVIIGGELAAVIGPPTVAGFLLHAGRVALGEAVVCFLLGVPLVRRIEESPALKNLFE